MQLKNKKIAIMQPTYLPWIGYFNLIYKSDIFVFLDSVQLAKRSWQVKNKIKSSNGELFLAVPIQKTNTRDKLLICESKIAYNVNWVEKHLKSIRHSYSKSYFFNEVYCILEEGLQSNFITLPDLNISLIKKISNMLNIETEFINSSKLKDINGKKDEILISICKKLNAGKYISPEGSKKYIESGNNLFVKNNIGLEYHDYKHPIYQQLYGNFISHLGIIDILFNLGFTKCEKIVKEIN